MNISRRLRQTSNGWKKLMVAGVAVGVLVLAGGIAYAAGSGDSVIKACAKTDNGQLRLDNGGGCLPSEQAVQWNQTGPPGPPGPPGPAGNSDSTVRHISNFMSDGTTVSTPILSAKGEIGKLSLLCGHDANGGHGEITFTQSSDPAFADRIIFYSPAIPSPPTVSVVNDHVTFPWAATPGDSILFEIMIEAEPGVPTKPTLTDIHGFVREFPQFGGCGFYVHVNTSEINSGETFTP